jgi:hypothetical protein
MLQSFTVGFIRDLLLNRPRPTRPRPSKPSSGSEVAVLGSCSVFSGALVVAVMGALAVWVGVGSAAVLGATTAGLLAVATGAGSASTGALAVAVGVVSATVGVLAVGVAQWSEIIFTPVTAMLLSEGLELAAVVVCPVTAMSWPTCRFRSTVLLVIL